MSEASSFPGSVIQPPFALSLTASVALLPGMAVTPLTGASAGQGGKAIASAAQTAVCAGLAINGQPTVGAQAQVIWGGALNLTVAQWDSALADSSTTGLTPGAWYYVSAATAGKLTATPPTGSNYITPVGIAITATLMLVMPGAPILASSL
jgi:hypothetical protein